MTAMNLAQKDLGQFMSEQSLKDVSPYKDEMTCTADMYKHMHKHTESYESKSTFVFSRHFTLFHASHWFHDESIILKISKCCKYLLH